MSEKNEKMDLMLARFKLTPTDFASITKLSLMTVQKMRLGRTYAGSIGLNSVIQIYQATKTKLGFGWSPWEYLYDCPDMSNNKSIVKEKDETKQKHADASLSKGKITLGDVSSVTGDEETFVSEPEKESDVPDGDYANLTA